MPKLKPHKGLLKRIKITGGNKVKFKRSGTSHLNSHMSGDSIQKHRQKRVVKSADAKRLGAMLHQKINRGD